MGTKKKEKKWNKINASHQKRLTGLNLPCVWSWSREEKKKKHFWELIRTYTIRDYSFNPQTMLAYGDAMQSWPGSDSIHIKHSTHLAMLRRAQTIAQMRVHPLKYNMRHREPPWKWLVQLWQMSRECRTWCVASLRCTHLRLQRRPFSPLLLSCVCVDTAHRI